jgi:hypothetical protein
MFCQLLLTVQDEIIKHARFDILCRNHHKYPIAAFYPLIGIYCPLLQVFVILANYPIRPPREAAGRVSGRTLLSSDETHNADD